MQVNALGGYASEWEEWFNQWMRTIAETDAEQQEGRGLFRMSNLGMGIYEGCPKEKLALLNGAEAADPNPGFTWMLTQGNRIHEMIQSKIWDDSLEQAGIEVPVEYDHNGTLWTGSADIVTDGHVMDIKTVRGGKFQYLDAPSLANEIQLQGYMMALDLEWGVLFYVDREGQNGVRCFDVTRNDERVLQAMTQVEAMVETGKVDPVGYQFSFTPTKTKGVTVRAKPPWQWGYCKLAQCQCEIRPAVSGIVARIERNQINLEPGVPSELAADIQLSYDAWRFNS